MKVFCVFQRLETFETLAAVCGDLGTAEHFIERRRVEALERNEPMSEWRVAEWQVLAREAES